MISIELMQAAMLGSYLSQGGVDDATIRQMLMGPRRQEVHPAWGGQTSQDMLEDLYEWGRDRVRDFWTGPMVGQIATMGQAGADVICVTDIRRPEEAQVIRGIGGMVISVVRPLPSGSAAPFHSHVDADDVDKFIINDGSPKSLQRLVRIAYREFFSLGNATN